MRKWRSSLNGKLVVLFVTPFGNVEKEKKRRNKVLFHLTHLLQDIANN